MKCLIHAILYVGILGLSGCSHSLSTSEAQSLVDQAPANNQPPNLQLNDTPEMRQAVQDLINSGNLKSVEALEMFSPGTVHYNPIYQAFDITCPLYAQNPVVVSVLNDSRNGIATAQVRYDLIPNQPFYQKICIEGKADRSYLSSRYQVITRQVIFQHFDEGWRIIGGL